MSSSNVDAVEALEFVSREGRVKPRETATGPPTEGPAHAAASRVWVENRVLPGFVGIPVRRLYGGQIQLYKSFFEGTPMQFEGDANRLISNDVGQRRLFAYLHEVAHLTGKITHNQHGGYDQTSISDAALNAWVWHECFQGGS